MNIDRKRKELMSLIELLDETRLDAILTLLKDSAGALLVRDNDWIEMEYRRNAAKKAQEKMVPAEDVQKRVKRKLNLIETSDEVHLDAIVALLKYRSEDLYASESDWKEIEQRQKDVEEGKVNDIDARAAGKRVQEALKKKRK